MEPTSRRTWWSSLVIQGTGGVRENPRVGRTLEYRSPSSRVTYYESVSVSATPSACIYERSYLSAPSVCRHPCYSRTRPCLRARPSTTQSRPQSKPSRPSVASAVADYEQRFDIRTRTRPVAWCGG